MIVGSSPTAPTNYAATRSVEDWSHTPRAPVIASLRVFLDDRLEERIALIAVDPLPCGFERIEP